MGISNKIREYNAKNRLSRLQNNRSSKFFSRTFQAMALAISQMGSDLIGFLKQHDLI